MALCQHDDGCYCSIKKITQETDCGNQRKPFSGLKKNKVKFGQQMIKEKAL